MRHRIALACSLVACAVVTTTYAADIPEIVVEPNAVRAITAHARLDAPVRFVNRTNHEIHVEFIGDRGEHHVVNVPLSDMVAALRKDTGAEVIYDDVPGRLVERLLKRYRSGDYVCPCKPTSRRVQ